MSSCPFCFYPHAKEDRPQRHYIYIWIDSHLCGGRANLSPSGVTRAGGCLVVCGYFGSDEGVTMGILAGMIGEKRSLSLTDKEVWKRLSLYEPTASGVSVTPQSALKYSAVFACVRVLAETVASLPAIMYERLPDGGKRRSQDFYLYNLLHNQPNPTMTAFQFLETAIAHLALWGNHYSFIDLSPRGKVMGLYPLNPARIERMEQDGEVFYRHQKANGKPVDYPDWQIWHIPGLSLDGVNGVSPISAARQSIGLGLAAEEFGARFFGNDARPGGVLRHPGIMDEDAYKRLMESWQSRHQGLDKSHTTAILEDGMTYEQIGLPPEDAQFLETRVHQVREIARFYRMPLHKIQDMGASTNNNIEHQGIEFVTDTIRPWLVRIEQSVWSNLMSKQEQARYFLEFLVDGLLRGDIQSRYTAYATARQWGWYSANDIRRFENQNPIPDGDIYLTPLNMIPADQVGDMPQNGAVNGARSLQVESKTGQNGLDTRQLEARSRKNAAERQRLANIQRPVFEEVMGRIIRRETQDISTQAKKMLGKRSLSEFDSWLEGFYREHQGWIETQVTPSFNAYVSLIARETGQEVESNPPDTTNFVRSYVASYAERHTTRHLAWVREIAERNQADPLPEIEATLDGWRETMPDRIAGEESNRLNNAAARFVYLASGILVLRWISLGETCPYCLAMDGRTIGIEDFFFLSGSSFEPNGAQGPMVANRNIGHPPLHEGCDCILTAG